MIIYKIQQNGYYGGTLEIPDDSIGIPLWTTTVSPPEIPDGFFAIWNGGGWNIVGESPKPIETPTEQQTNIQITPELIQLQNDIIQQVQNRLDQFARTRNYENMLSVCTYINDPNPNFAFDADYCFRKRSETWTKIYSILDDVLSGKRPIPTSYYDIEHELPVLNWSN